MPISSGLMALAGIGEGLREGVKTYKSFRDADEERKNRNATMGLLAAKSGYDYDPSQGLLTQNALGAAQQESGLAEAGLKTATAKQGTQEIDDQNNPDSDFATSTNALGTAFGGYLRKMGKKGEYNDLADTLSNPGVSPRVKKLITEHPAMKDLMAGMKADASYAQAMAVAKTRGDATVDSAKIRGAATAAGVELKTDKATREQVKALQKDLDADAGRTGNFGQISNKLIQAQVLKRLATDADGSIINLPAPQQEEMAMGMARLLSGSNVNADARIKALVPHSAWGDGKKMLSWLINEPEGADQQKFTQYMLTTIDREEKLANEQMKQIRLSRLTAHDELRRKNPRLFHEALGRYGITPEEAAAPPGGMMQATPGLLKSAPAAAADPNEGKIIEDANGNRQVRRDGKWVPI